MINTVAGIIYRIVQVPSFAAKLSPVYRVIDVSFNRNPSKLIGIYYDTATYPAITAGGCFLSGAICLCLTHGNNLKSKQSLTGHHLYSIAIFTRTRFSSLENLVISTISDTPITIIPI